MRHQNVHCKYSAKSNYHTRANKGRRWYSKNIFWPMVAANNWERLLIKNYLSTNEVYQSLFLKHSNHLEFLAVHIYWNWNSISNCLILNYILNFNQKFHPVAGWPAKRRDQAMSVLNLQGSPVCNGFLSTYCLFV